MGKKIYDVFISYRRRTGSLLAITIREMLRRHGIEAFVDQQEMHGRFDETLLECIEQTPNFMLLLTQGSLDELKTEDWFRREIAHALQTNRNIISVRLQGYEPPPAASLPEDIRVISRHHHWTFVEEYPDALIDRIITKLVIPTRVTTQRRSAGRIAATLRQIDKGRLCGILTLVIVICCLITVVAFREFRNWTPNPADVTRLIQHNRWIGYDPSQFDPTRNPAPSLDSIVSDLTQLRTAGFTGIITYGGSGTLKNIPELARKEGLKTIMGVWDAANDTEIATAAMQYKYVDAYCVGHNSLDRDYVIADLARATRRLRNYTHRPVSTTELAIEYKFNERLAKLGDWLFPDAHLEISDSPGTRSNVNINRDVATFMQSANDLAKVAQALHQPLMFKTVAYPWHGAFNASEDAQAEFYSTLIDTLRSPQSGLPLRVSIAAHSAFDSPWKVGGEFQEWDPYTGLLDLDGTPRLACKEITARLP